MATPAIDKITTEELRSRLARHVEACNAFAPGHPVDEGILFIGIYRNEVPLGKPEFSVLLRGVVGVNITRSIVEGITLREVVATFQTRGLLRELNPEGATFRRVEACLGRLGHVTLIVHQLTFRHILEVDVETLH